MRNPWRIVHQIVERSNVILEIIDARLPETRNEKLQKVLKKHRKRALRVYNKADLIPKNEMDKDKFYFSAKTRKGKAKLIRKILELGGGKVGVVGLPNVGKSSLINALAGRRAARTSPTAGFTKGMQYIRAHPRILLLDTPGVIPPGTTKEDLVLMNAQNVDETDPILTFLKLWPKIRNDLMKKYECPDNPEKALEVLARKLNMLLKGGEADKNRAAKHVIHKWSTGKEF